MDGLYIRERLLAATDVGLIRHDDEHIARLAETAAPFRDPRQEPELIDGRGRMRKAGAEFSGVQGPVAIEENCRAFIF